MAELLTAVTYPQFVLFKHVLCFARIMSYNTKLEMYSICEEFLDMAYNTQLEMYSICEEFLDV